MDHGRRKEAGATRVETKVHTNKQKQLAAFTLLGFRPAIFRVWRRGAELGVGVRLALCYVGPDGGTGGGGGGSSVVGLSQVGRGQAEVTLEEIQVLSGLRDREAAEGALQLLVSGGDGDGGLLCCCPAGLLPYRLCSVRSAALSGAVPVGPVPSVSLSSWGRR